MRFFLEDQMAEVTHRRKCKGFFERCAKNKKIFAIPPARDRPAAGPPRGPSAALQHAERERPRAGARSARGHRPRAARRAAAGRQLAPSAPCHAMPAIGRGHQPGPASCRGHRPGPASCRPRTGAGSGSAGSAIGSGLTELTQSPNGFLRAVYARGPVSALFWRGRFRSIRSIRQRK